VNLDAAGPFYYRGDSVVDGWSASGLEVRGATGRGYAHRYYGRPRQDEMSLAWHSGSSTLVAVVADGVSAAPMSHVGAATVCRYSSEYVLRHLSNGEPIDPRELIEGCAWALTEAAQRLRGASVADAAIAEELMATTVAVVTVALGLGSASVSGVVVGDSGIGVVESDQVTFLAGGRKGSSDGITDVSVTALPRIPEQLITAELRLEPGQTLLVATDGIWDPVGDGRGTVASHLAAALHEKLPGRGAFLEVVDFVKETHDDDRTLIAVRLADIPRPPGLALRGVGGAQKESDQSDAGDESDQSQLRPPVHPAQVQTREQSNAEDGSTTDPEPDEGGQEPPR